MGGTSTSPSKNRPYQSGQLVAAEDGGVRYVQSFSGADFGGTSSSDAPEFANIAYLALIFGGLMFGGSFLIPNKDDPKY